MRIIEGKLMGNFCEISLFLLFDGERGMLKCLFFVTDHLLWKLSQLRMLLPFFDIAW